MSNTETVGIGSALKITVSREELAQKLALVGRGVSTRTAVQILGGILVRAEGGKVELAATDMELSLRTTLEAKEALGAEAVEEVALDDPLIARDLLPQLGARLLGVALNP